MINIQTISAVQFTFDGSISKTEGLSPSSFDLAFMVLYYCLQFYTTLTIPTSGETLLLTAVPTSGRDQQTLQLYYCPQFYTTAITSNSGTCTLLPSPSLIVADPYYCCHSYQWSESTNCVPYLCLDQVIIQTQKPSELINIELSRHTSKDLRS